MISSVTTSFYFIALLLGEPCYSGAHFFVNLTELELLIFLNSMLKVLNHYPGKLEPLKTPYASISKVYLIIL